MDMRDLRELARNSKNDKASYSGSTIFMIVSLCLAVVLVVASMSTFAARRASLESGFDKQATPADGTAIVEIQTAKDGAGLFAARRDRCKQELYGDDDDGFYAAVDQMSLAGGQSSRLFDHLLACFADEPPENFCNDEYRRKLNIVVKEFFRHDRSLMNAERKRIAGFVKKLGGRMNTSVEESYEAALNMFMAGQLRREEFSLLFFGEPAWLTKMLEGHKVENLNCST